MQDLNLSRTAKAIQDYDERVPELERKLITPRDQYEVVAVVREIEKLDEAVGIAFGEDTRDRNNPETCRQCVRPGPKEPSPGFELSFVRRLVLEWEATQRADAAYAQHAEEQDQRRREESEGLLWLPDEG